MAAKSKKTKSKEPAGTKKARAARQSAADVRKRQAALDLYHAMLKHGSPAQKKRAMEGLAAMGESPTAGATSQYIAPSGNEHIENMRRMPGVPAWLAAMTPTERKRLAASMSGPEQHLTPAQERAVLRNIGPDADFRRAARAEGDPVMRRAGEEHRRMLAAHGYRMLPNGKIVLLNPPPARKAAAPKHESSKHIASPTRTRNHSAAPKKDLSRYRVPVSQKNPEGLRWPADHPAAHRRAAQGRKHQNRP